MRIKEIKDETRKGRTGGLRHKAQEAVVADELLYEQSKASYAGEELDHELEVFRKQIRKETGAD